MKAMNRYIRKTARLMLCLLTSAATLASCIYEDEVPCPVELRFVYDYNMEFADAFPHRVRDLQLYIFGQDGTLLDTRRATAPDGGFGETYRMNLQDLPAGTYTFLAWATDNAEAATKAYAFEPITTTRAALADLGLGIHPDAAEYCDLTLPDLWHGLLRDFTITGQEPAQATIHLVQDVKRFRVMLQRADGQRLATADYAFSITADNARLDYDNSILPSNAPTIYTPYSLEEANVANGRTTTGSLHALVGELNTLRLDATAPARFRVSHTAEGRDLFDLDLIHYLELMRLDRHAGMPLQEYLDRENTWNVIFVIGGDAGSKHLLSIQINQWIMVFNETEL